MDVNITYVIPAWIAAVMQEVMLDEFVKVVNLEGAEIRSLALDLATDILPHGLPSDPDERSKLIRAGYEAAKATMEDGR